MKSNSIQLMQGIPKDIVTVYQISQICRYVQNIVLSIVLVKSAISINSIGKFEILLFLMAILSQFWVSGIKDAVVSNYEKSPPDEKDVLLKEGFWGLVILGMISMALFFGLYPFFFKADELTDIHGYIPFVCLYLFFGALSSYPETILLLKNKPIHLLYFSVLSTFLFFILMAVFFWFSPTLLFVIIVLLGLAISKCIFLLSILPGLKVSDYHRVFLFLKRCFPFFLIATIGYGMEMVDGFFVVHFFDISQFPIYKYGARELPFSSLLMNSLSVAMIPFLANLSRIQDIKHKVNRHMHFLFPLTIGFMWLSPFLFEFFYNADFKESAYIFNIYLLILGSRLLLPHSVLLANGKQKWVLYSGIVELLVNIILSFWWVQLWGLPGLVMATVVAYYTQKVIMMYLVKKHFGLQFTQFISVKWWIFYQIAAFVSFYLVFVWEL